MNSILENIDTIRRNRGYSQEYLAMQIGMKQAGFSLIMSGERELKYNTLLQIANALQMSVIDVITFPDKYVMAKGNGTSTEAVLQIKLDSDKKDQILNIVFGEQIAELLKSKLFPFGTEGDARTPDTLFWRPVLYQLSYFRVCGCKGKRIFYNSNYMYEK